MGCGRLDVAGLYPWVGNWLFISPREAFNSPLGVIEGVWTGLRWVFTFGGSFPLECARRSLDTQEGGCEDSGTVFLLSFYDAVTKTLKQLSTGGYSKRLPKETQQAFSPEVGYQYIKGKIRSVPGRIIAFLQLSSSVGSGKMSCGGSYSKHSQEESWRRARSLGLDC